MEMDNSHREEVGRKWKWEGRNNTGVMVEEDLLRKKNMRAHEVEMVKDSAKQGSPCLRFWIAAEMENVYLSIRRK